MKTAIVLFVYAGIIEAGGVAGFVKAGRRASLIASSVFGALLVAAGAMLWLDVTAGLYFAFIITMALVGLFGSRFSRTKKFMPAGLMLVVSVIVLGALASVARN